MAKIFCVANQKGGVGKTTTTVNLAAGLAKIGQRVLMIDLDPQGNATMGSGVDKRALELSVYDVLLESASVAEARQRSEKTGYDVLGANRELAGAEVELVELERRDKRLKAALAAAEGEYDFVLIDCPPSLSLLTLNGLCAAHGVVVPMQCEYFALEGLSDLVNTIKQVHANLNPDLQIIGLLRVMFDPRITLQQQVSEQLKAHFGDKVFDSVIPRNVRLAEAPSYGLPGVVFAICCPELDVSCVDTVGKKAAFIQQVAASLKLPNLHGIHARVETLTGPFDVICCRAFAALPDFVNWSRGALAGQGVWMAMKGKHPQAEIDALPADVQVFHVEPLRVPGLDAERCMVWLRPADRGSALPWTDALQRRVSAAPMPAAIDAVADAFAQLSGGRADVPLRVPIGQAQHESHTFFMPALLANRAASTFDQVR